jgi:hypothetical protein
MEINNRVRAILAKEIAQKCESEEHLNTTIEVMDNNISYFVEFEYMDKGDNLRGGIITLDVTDITVFNADAEPLERSNIKEVCKWLSDKASY